jgi:methionyl-tRNA formyltransferase
LPRWRGAAPIQRAILAGDERTGMCIMQMEKGLDTGPVYARRDTDIGDKTAGELTAELAAMGGAMMAEVLARIDQIVPEPQPEEGVTYAHKIDKAEARLDFAQPAGQVERQVRAFNPVPGAWFEHAGERVKVLAAQLLPLADAVPAGTVLDEHLSIACGSGAIVPTLVQRAGRSVMGVDELMRGFPVPPGTMLA